MKLTSREYTLLLSQQTDINLCLLNLLHASGTEDLNEVKEKLFKSIERWIFLYNNSISLNEYDTTFGE